MSVVPGERIIELILEIVLEAMKGQPADVRAQIWRWHVQDVAWWRRLFKIDGPEPSPTPPDLRNG